MTTMNLPDTLAAATEWTNETGTNFRFTNVAPNEWIVHRTHDHGYVAHLRRDNNVYDFITESGNPSITATTVSLSKVTPLLV